MSATVVTFRRINVPGAFCLCRAGKVKIKFAPNLLLAFTLPVNLIAYT
jgi:hypothetical protein